MTSQERGSLQWLVGSWEMESRKKENGCRTPLDNLTGFRVYESWGRNWTDVKYGDWIPGEFIIAGEDGRMEALGEALPIRVFERYLTAGSGDVWRFEYQRLAPLRGERLRLYNRPAGLHWVFRRVQEHPPPPIDRNTLTFFFPGLTW